MKMYFLLKMGIFQPAMLVYQRVLFFFVFQFRGKGNTHPTEDLLNHPTEDVFSLNFEF